MSVKAQLRVFLLADVAVQAALSSATAVYHKRAPTGAAYPHLVYHWISSPGHHHLRGVSAIRSDLVQINAVALTSPEVDALADAVEARLDGHTGLMGTQHVQSAKQQTRRDLVEDRPDSSNDVVHTVQLDYELWYRRA